MFLVFASLLPLLISLHVHRISAAGPLPTVVSGFQGTVSSPTTTARPQNAPFALDLKARGAPSNVCGYFSGDAQSPYACSLGSQCAVNYPYSVMGCCPNGQVGNCELATTCVDYETWANCDGTCSFGWDVGQCSLSDFPYCGTFVSSTYVSSPNVQTFTAYLCIPNSGVSGVQIPIKALAGSTTAPLPAAANPTSHNTAGVDIGTCDSCVVNTGNNSTQTVNQTQGTSDKGGLSKGDIAGIVIGTLTGVLTLIGLFIACCK